MTARPVGDGDGYDAPREALVGVLAYWYPDAGTGQAHTPEEHLQAADAVLALPELGAWVERRARERAAEELTTLAFRLLDLGIPDRVFEEIVAARDALAADNRTGRR